MQFEIKNVSVLYPQTGAVLNNINLNIIESNTSNKYIQLNDELKTTHRLESVNDILLYKDEILRVSKQFN